MYTVSLPLHIPLSIAKLSTIAKELNCAKIAVAVKSDVLQVFAEDESASVQVSRWTIAAI